MAFWNSVGPLKVPAMIVYDMVMHVLDTKWFPQHNIAGLISGITFIVLFQLGEASTVEGNKHTHTHLHTHTHTGFLFVVFGLWTNLAHLIIYTALPPN